MLSTVAGIALLVLTLGDVLLQIFHPAPAGSPSSFVMRGMWSLFRRPGPLLTTRLRLAGPTIVVAVLIGWAILLVLGWALVYWPRLPDQFESTAPFLDGGAGRFVDALYLSMVTLATLGFGDITPASWQLRLLAPVQAFIGFALLSAGISWILSIQPVLARRRALALRVQLAYGEEARLGTGLATLPQAVALPLLLSFTERLAHVRSDLLATPVTYFFDRAEWGASLPAVLPYLNATARRVIQRAPSEEIRYAASLMAGTIEHLARALAEHIPDGREMSVDGVLIAYAKDHCRPLIDEPDARNTIDHDELRTR